MLEDRDSHDKSYDWVKGEIGPKDMRSLFTDKTFPYWHRDSHYIREAVVRPCYVYHYSDVIIGAITSQITSLTIVYSTVYSGANQRKHQSSASLAFYAGNSPGPVNSPHKWPVTRKMFPFDDVIMWCKHWWPQPVCFTNHYTHWKLSRALHGQ